MLKLIPIAALMLISCNKKNESSASKKPAQYEPAPQNTNEPNNSNAASNATNYPSTQPVVTTTTLPANPTCIAASAQICEAEFSITLQMNDFRRQSGLGLPDLAHNPYLSAVARTWSYGQAALRDISHDGFPNSRTSVFRTLFPNIAMPFMSAENVAMTQGRYATPQALAQEFSQMWINSAGHRENIVGRHRTIGVGIADSPNGYYATQLFGK